MKNAQATLKNLHLPVFVQSIELLTRSLYWSKGFGPNERGKYAKYIIKFIINSNEQNRIIQIFAFQFEWFNEYLNTFKKWFWEIRVQNEFGIRRLESEGKIDTLSVWHWARIFAKEALNYNLESRKTTLLNKVLPIL